MSFQSAKRRFLLSLALLHQVPNYIYSADLYVHRFIICRASYVIALIEYVKVACHNACYSKIVVLKTMYK